MHIIRMCCVATVAATAQVSPYAPHVEVLFLC